MFYLLVTPSFASGECRPIWYWTIVYSFVRKADIFGIAKLGKLNIVSRHIYWRGDVSG
ncbi:hypothetical protein VroAM7_51020 (plasmid) [Vibrio rotiferianus]|uniref:Uncharacterized protein n=1 Tax=Vibrio rotiferianus TaxID=190895 RepID=A0A510IFI3_9VIBR|nr:hypothetical protein VroAM7_51020 [Vibrio rotiferianus]